MIHLFFFFYHKLMTVMCTTLDLRNLHFVEEMSIDYISL